MFAVLVIDMQNAYFEDPALAPHRERTVAACNALISLAAAHGIPGLLVKTEHERDRSTWTLNMLDDGQGFIYRGSAQADFVAGLHTSGLPQLTKTRDSSFMGTDLLWRLHNWRVETLVLAGVSAHNCIAQTAADAFAHNFRVVHAVDAVAGNDPAFQGFTQDLLAREYRQKMLSHEEIMALFSRHPVNQSSAPTDGIVLPGSP
ncbi:cysteine hydrolase family protein [Arthrobacter celericrescens]|uniref:cysteine hydrolase family protein n=1 Tax=Arthrobacter celericrescens TaxID=2320851 RepID=UPI000EA3F2F3|nr:isochorismatase family cysteine hydrolase [Arthrobacter celericrescens]